MAASPRPAVALTGKQQRYLRGLAHDLDAVVQVGKQGWSDGVRAEIDQALDVHELIKIRLGGEAPLELGELAENVETQLGASVAQTIGRLVVAYRRHPKTPRIVLPRAGAAKKGA